MPGNGGLYGLIRIREDYPSLPIAVVSGSEDANIVSKVMGYGAMGFIPKSSSSDDIANAINQILEGDTWLPTELKNKNSPKFKAKTEKLQRKLPHLPHNNTVFYNTCTKVC